MGNAEASTPKPDAGEVQRKQSRMFVTRGLGWSLASGLTVAFGTWLGGKFAGSGVGIAGGGFGVAVFVLTLFASKGLEGVVGSKRLAWPLAWIIMQGVVCAWAGAVGMPMASIEGGPIYLVWLLGAVHLYVTVKAPPKRKVVKVRRAPPLPKVGTPTAQTGVARAQALLNDLNGILGRIPKDNTVVNFKRIKDDLVDVQVLLVKALMATDRFDLNPDREAVAEPRDLLVARADATLEACRRVRNALSIQESGRYDPNPNRLSDALDALRVSMTDLSELLVEA